jgi:alpha-tubulin suppressor-like RCC1 family protein
MRSMTESWGRVAVAATLLALGAGCKETTQPAVPTSVLLVSGDGQLGVASQPLAVPLVVKVVDAAGLGVPDLPVAWSVTLGGGRVVLPTGADSAGSSPDTLWATTNVYGMASATWRLGAGGPNAVAASAGGAGSVTFSASASIVARAVSTGYNLACALSQDGDAYCWGSNQYGQLGNGSTIPSSTPVQVAGGMKFTSIVAGGNLFACGLATTGAAYCWGWNQAGYLGNGSTSNSSTPVPVAGGLTFASIATGSFNACGLTSSGAAYCWGENAAGQIGDSTTTTRLIPTPVSGGLTFSSLSLGYRRVCGVTTGGATYCWGSGQVPTTPVLAPGNRTFVTVTVGFSHVCGLAADGRAYCWWGNGFGQLGNGTTTGSATPVPVAGALTFRSLSTSWYHTCGTTTSGSAYCWGRNEKGEVGDGMVGDTVLSPTPVTGGLSFTSISTSTDASCALTTPGAVYCWGWNNYGQVGDGTVVDASAPKRVTFF